MTNLINEIPLSEAAIAFPLLLKAQAEAEYGDGFCPFNEFATDLDRCTDDCIRFSDGIECLVWQGSAWHLELDV